ncbi:MAG TPA: DUF1735 domain-containing protein [Agriterribacter sp.]|nr:DUF1735 domain-containing protein [Agriterribacter sp.]HRQ51981.1 DUF1735 domain-containing protein [Agriterribacter sp.]
MKNSLNQIILLAGMLALTAACKKEKEVVSVREGTIYMTQALDARSELSLLIADTQQVFTFGAAYGGLLYPSEDIQVDFKVATDLIDAYNNSHATSYSALPQDKYSISGLSTVIRAGRTTSEAISVSVQTKNLPKDAEYLLPVSIVNAGTGKINSELQTAYFRIKITRKETDLTSSAVLSVSKDNGGGADAGEGSSKLTDNNLNTKFLTDGFPITLWMQLQLAEPAAIQAYRLTSGNDAPERDPKNWQMLASNNGTDWTVLDTRTDQVFSGRNQTVQYEFDNDTPYLYYRWQVDENNGSSLFQISEWRLITFK